MGSTARDSSLPPALSRSRVWPCCCLAAGDVDVGAPLPLVDARARHEESHDDRADDDARDAEHRDAPEEGDERQERMRLAAATDEPWPQQIVVRRHHAQEIPRDEEE